jgi:polyisoprenoid-binding protein YceI
MRGRMIIVVLLGMGAHTLVAQKFVLTKSTVTFFSDAAIEDIKATNTKTSSLLNATTGEIVFSVPITEFQFDKSLMRTHFNEKYMESEKYPKALFQGKIIGMMAEAKEEQAVKAKGKLTIHGVTKEVEIPGTIQFNASEVVAKAKFMVRLEDYKIKIPQLLWQNIAEEVEVTVDFTYKSN